MMTGSSNRFLGDVVLGEVTVNGRQLQISISLFKCRVRGEQQRYGAYIRATPASGGPNRRQTVGPCDTIVQVIEKLIETVNRQYPGLLWK